MMAKNGKVCDCWNQQFERFQKIEALFRGNRKMLANSAVRKMRKSRKLLSLMYMMKSSTLEKIRRITNLVIVRFS